MNQKKKDRRKPVLRLHESFGDYFRWHCVQMYPPGLRSAPVSLPVRSITSFTRAPLCTSWQEVLPAEPVVRTPTAGHREFVLPAKVCGKTNAAGATVF